MDSDSLRMVNNNLPVPPNTCELRLHSFFIFTQLTWYTTSSWYWQRQQRQRCRCWVWRIRQLWCIWQLQRIYMGRDRSRRTRCFGKWGLFLYAIFFPTSVARQLGTTQAPTTSASTAFSTGVTPSSATENANIDPRLLNELPNPTSTQSSFHWHCTTPDNLNAEDGQSRSFAKLLPARSPVSLFSITFTI